MERRYRLSRSKDFDAVYRQGRSVSTRYLTLHWFPREDDPAGEPRLGLAVPKSVGNAVVRNRLKRQLRETWQELAADVPAGRDYVLAARSGVAEPADTRGHAVARGAGDRGAREGGGVRYVGIALVQAWRHTFGRLTPAGTCKYHPSCSQYAIDAFRAHGLFKGGVFAGWRLLRCNPWSHGGVDRAEDARFGRRRRETEHPA